MDLEKVGKIITKLRRDKGLKQKDIAEKMNISDKTVSKWERGLGFPDVSLLNEFTEILGTSAETLLGGKLAESKNKNDNIKNIKFYYCPICGNVLTAFGGASIYCCGRKAEEKKPIKYKESDLSVNLIENEYVVESSRDMTKDYYYPFVAYVTCESLTLSRQYPEWNLCVRFANVGRGRLFFADNLGNLFYQDI